MGVGLKSVSRPSPKGLLWFITNNCYLFGRHGGQHYYVCLFVRSSSLYVYI